MDEYLSPSSRRAWIEINYSDSSQYVGTSPSSRRAWIEIVPITAMQNAEQMSPSSRRAWIEIDKSEPYAMTTAGRPPRGGRG